MTLVAVARIKPSHIARQYVCMTGQGIPVLIYRIVRQGHKEQVDPGYTGNDSVGKRKRKSPLLELLLRTRPVNFMENRPFQRGREQRH